MGGTDVGKNKGPQIISVASSKERKAWFFLKWKLLWGSWECGSDGG